MKIVALLLAGLAATGVRTQLTYSAVRGSETRTHRLSFDGSNPGSDYQTATLRGAIVQISERDVSAWQLTTG